MGLATVSACPDVPSESAIGNTSKAAQLVETSWVMERDTSRSWEAGTLHNSALTSCVFDGHCDIHSVAILPLGNTRQTMTGMGLTACDLRSTNSA